MRYWAALLSIGWAGSVALGQSPGYEAVVRQPTEIRGGKSSIIPATGRLPAGARVRVQREEAGWLAITPPQGSSSWILERMLDGQPQAGQRGLFRVLADDAPILLGTPESAKPLPNECARVKRGTIVEVLGERAQSDALGDSAVFWRIAPTVNEVRWVTRDALSNTPVTSPLNGGGQVVQRPIDSQPLPELWTRAELAERNGQYDVAVVYYRQLAQEQSRPGGNTSLAYQASARADYLSRRSVTTAARPITPIPPSNAPPPLAGGPGPWNASTMMKSGPGVLRRAAFQIDGQTAYALEDDRGYPRMYVTAQPGLNLEPFINRRVELFGPMVNRQELAIRGYMAVKTLHVLR